jgi:acyl CoA:acetate/3-ketoacid CoA transferase beta subunit
LAVCEVPFGAHPAGVWAPGIVSYAEDYAFMAEVRAAARSDFDGWFERRIAGGEYLASLDRDELRRRASLGPASVSPKLDPPTAAERAIVEAARLLRHKCKNAGHRTLLAGIGAANLAAWLAVRQIAADGLEVDLMAELGLFGYWPQPGEPFVFNFANLPTCVALGEIDEIMGLHLRRGAAVVGAAQIDAVGNVNTTQIPGERYLLGSGGHNDCASSAADVVVVCSADRLVDRVAYVTSPGERVSAVVTERGVFEKVEGRFRLRSLPSPDALEYLRAHAFAFETFPEVELWRDPDAEALALLAAWDPHGHFRRG